MGMVTYVGHTADEGRDLILEGYKGRKAIVERKHQPNSGIGRPIVQKLHSATIEEKCSICDRCYDRTLHKGHSRICREVEIKRDYR